MCNFGLFILFFCVLRFIKGLVDLRLFLVLFYLWEVRERVERSELRECFKLLGNNFELGGDGSDDGDGGIDGGGGDDDDSVGIGVDVVGDDNVGGGDFVVVVYGEVVALLRMMKWG